MQRKPTRNQDGGFIVIYCVTLLRNQRNAVMKRSVIFLAVLSVFALGLNVSAIAGNSFAGTWSCAASGEGPNHDQTGHFSLVLKQSGNTVTGSYYDGNASLSGTVQGNTVKGTFTEASGKGLFSFILSDDGNGFTGSWGPQDGTKSGTWNGTRQ
jgi:MscS family membrane protein